MPYRCPARHTSKEDVYYFGDGIHKLFYEHCCKESVSEAGSLCKKHAKRFEGEYKTKDQRLLCQWNYVFHHGLIGEAYNTHTQMYGSPYYVEGLKKGWGSPKKRAMEKAVAMQKEVCDLAISMQMKITDYMKTGLGEAEAEKDKPSASPKPKPKSSAGRKKRVQADQTSMVSSSSSSGASSSGASSSVSGSRLPMYIPKGPVAYAEAEDDPIIIAATQISTLTLRANPAGGWMDDEGKHYRKSASGLILGDL